MPLHLETLHPQFEIDGFEKYEEFNGFSRRYVKLSVFVLLGKYLKIVKLMYIIILLGNCYYYSTF